MSSTLTRPAPGSSTPRSRRPPARRVLAWIVGVSCLAGAALWAGMRVEPAPLPAPALAEGAMAMTALPADLPAPVERFYRTLYGEQLPVPDTLVVSGRGTMRIQGITFPSRFRFSHRAGADYRHYIETTVFGAPLLKVNEWYVDGAGRLELPFGVSEGPKVDQGANLALWAELVWAPAVWVTSPDARTVPVTPVLPDRLTEPPDVRTRPPTMLRLLVVMLPLAQMSPATLQGCARFTAPCTTSEPATSKLLLQEKPFSA